MAMSDFDGLRVLSLESRRAEEMRRLIARRGGVATVAPSMREVPVAGNEPLERFLEALYARHIDTTVWMTGAGVRLLVETLSAQPQRADWSARVGQTIVVARGPKPASALRELGVAVAHNVPEPNTWREILQVLDANVHLESSRVAVQEYGVPNRAFVAELQARGAEVMRAPVYKWALPEETGPLSAALDALCDGGFDVVLFTAGTQALHALQLAERQGRESEVRAALQSCVVASIGPTTSEALRELGMRIDFEPSHPKMGQLVNECAENAPALLRQARRDESPSCKYCNDTDSLNKAVT